MKDVNGMNHIKLEETYFCPTTPLYLGDKGYIGDVRISKVILNDDDEVIHIGNKKLNQLINEHCRIDYAHRQLSMQQLMATYIMNHTFKDILCCNTLDCRTTETTSILEVKGIINPEDLILAEDYANGLIQSGLDVLTEKDSSTGDQKVVVKGIFSAKSFGPALKNVSETALIKITHFKHAGNSTYVHYIAGKLAIEDYRNKSTLCTKIINSLRNDFPNETLSELKEFKKKLIK